NYSRVIIIRPSSKSTRRGNRSATQCSASTAALPLLRYADCVHTQVAYNTSVKAVFVELPAFERYRADYLDDKAFGNLQAFLMSNPEAGDVIEGTGGLRKMRFADRRRGKGKRGGLRVIYYWWS